MKESIKILMPIWEKFVKRKDFEGEEVRMKDGEGLKENIE